MRTRRHSCRPVSACRRSTALLARRSTARSPAAGSGVGASTIPTSSMAAAEDDAVAPREHVEELRTVQVAVVDVRPGAAAASSWPLIGISSSIAEQRRRRRAPRAVEEAAARRQSAAVPRATANDRDVRSSPPSGDDTASTSRGRNDVESAGDHRREACRILGRERMLARPVGRQRVDLGRHGEVRRLRSAARRRSCRTSASRPRSRARQRAGSSGAANRTASWQLRHERAGRAGRYRRSRSPRTAPAATFERRVGRQRRGVDGDGEAVVLEHPRRGQPDHAAADHRRLAVRRLEREPRRAMLAVPHDSVTPQPPWP